MQTRNYNEQGKQGSLVHGIGPPPILNLMMLWYAAILLGVVAAVRHDYQDSSVRIVGGKVASAGKYSSYGIPVGNMLCGGTLIAPDIMVSAAHCKGAFTAGPSTVAFGGTTIGATNAKEIIGVQYEVIHPGYIEATAENDIMIVVLARPSHSKPAYLNQDELYPIDGQSVTAIGFGNTAEGGQVAEHLREVKTNIVSPEICSAAYDQVSIDVPKEIMLCTGVFGGGKGSCQGDSGGPILDDAGVLIGVVSWGKGCASATYPGVNARISAYVPFLEDAICSFSQHSRSFCEGLVDDDNTPVEDWFGNVTKPEDGWAHAVSQNVSTTDGVWNISRPLILTEAADLDKSFGASSQNETDGAWQNITNMTSPNGLLDFGNSSDSTLLLSQTPESPNSAAPSSFGLANDTSLALTNTSATNAMNNTEATNQSSSNFTTNTTAISLPVDTNATKEENLVGNDRQQTTTDFGSFGNIQMDQNISTLEVNATNDNNEFTMSTSNENNKTAAVSPAANYTSAPTTSPSFDMGDNETEGGPSTQPPSEAPTAFETAELFELPSLKSQYRDGNYCRIACTVAVAIVWCALH